MKNRNNWVRVLLILAICISGFAPLSFVLISFSLFALVLLEMLYFTEQLVLNIKMAKKDILGVVLSFTELLYYFSIIDNIDPYYDYRLMLLLLLLLIDIIFSNGRESYIVRDLGTIKSKTILQKHDIFYKNLFFMLFLILSNIIVFLMFNSLNDSVFIIFVILGLCFAFYRHVSMLLVYSNSLFLRGLVFVTVGIILYMPLFISNVSFFKSTYLSILLYFIYVLSYTIIWHIISVNFYRALKT